jgi:hypothetical protein
MLTLGSGVLKAKAWTAGGVYSGQVNGSTITLTGASTGGALSDGTYYVKIIAKNLISGSSYAEGEPSTEASVVLSGGTSTQKITIGWTAVGSAEAYDIYVGTTSGRTFRQVTNTTTNPYQLTSALTTTDQQAEHRGLLTIGEIGGDVEYNIEFQEKEFYGQANFAIAKYFYGGKASISAKKVEIDPTLLARVMNVSIASTYNGTAGRWEDEISPDIDLRLKPLYLEFTHTRSDDPSKTVVIKCQKACLYKFPLPFMREDIATYDLDFTLQYDSTTAKLVAVEVA